MLMLILLACSPAPPPSAPTRVDPDVRVEVRLQAPHTIEERAGLRYIDMRTTGTLPEGAPTFLVLHGRGTDPEHLASWFQYSDGAARFLLPYGPKALDHGLGWFDTPINGPAANLSKEIASHAAMVSTWLAEVHPEPVLAVGWSQGGMIATGLALSHPERVREAWVGGVRLPIDILDNATAEARPIHVVHGTVDAVAPFADARGAVQRLVERGVPATFQAIEGGDHRFQGAAFDAKLASVGITHRDEAESNPAQTSGPDVEWDGKSMKPGPDGVPH